MKKGRTLICDHMAYKEPLLTEPQTYLLIINKSKMKQVLSKLATARLFIKSHPIKKDGRNDFSKYDYFTPEIVSKLVNDACIEADIICTFSLKQDTLGFYGEVITTDLETGEFLITEMRTARPQITATNETQQMGGMNTYAKRYALMSLFDIEDNTIDFDAQDNTKKAVRPTNNTSGELPWLNENTKEFTGAVEKMKAGKSSIAALQKFFKISKKVEEKLNQAVKNVDGKPAPTRNNNGDAVMGNHNNDGFLGDIV
jgi:hypothetical protein